MKKLLTPLALVLALAAAESSAYPSCDPLYNTTCPLSNSSVITTTVTPANQTVPLSVSSQLSKIIFGGFGGGGAFGGNPTSHGPLSPDGATGVSAGSAASPKWHAWGSLGQSNVGYAFQPARSSGRVNLVLGGIDYTFNNKVILGAAYADDRTRIATDFNSGSLSGSGYSIAPYVAVPFARNWLFDASIGWGRNKLAQIDNSGATVTGKAVDARFSSSLALSYAAQAGKLQWSGKGMYLFSEDKIGQFTLSNNTLVPSSTTRVAQLRLGGELAYDAGGWAPFAGLTYIRDVQSPTQPVTAGLTPANDRDAWQLALGATVYSRGPLSGGVQYSQDFNRKEVKNNLLMAHIAYKF